MNHDPLKQAVWWTAAVAGAALGARFFVRQVGRAFVATARLATELFKSIGRLFT